MNTHRAMEAAALVGLVLLAAGCGGPVLKEPPPDVRAAIEHETKRLTGESGDMYYAGLKLGDIGLTYRLPPATVEALRAACGNSDLGYTEIDYFYIGGICRWYEGGDGPRIAFLMWRLRDMDSDRDRIQLLWETFCERHRTGAMADFCIESLVGFKGDAVVPYLFAAAAMGNWYQARCAAFYLGDHWPIARPLLLLLARSDRKDIAEIARRNLRREGKSLPMPPSGFTTSDHEIELYGIPAWPGIPSGE